MFVDEKEIVLLIATEVVDLKHVCIEITRESCFLEGRRVKYISVCFLRSTKTIKLPFCFKSARVPLTNIQFKTKTIKVTQARINQAPTKNLNIF